MNELFKLLNSIYPLTDELKEHLKDVLETRTFAEGELLLKAGHVCRHIYFVEEGLLRINFNNKKGNDVNKWFLMKGDVVYAVRSFLNQTISTESIQALEKTTVHYILYEQLQQIYKEHIIFYIHGLKLTEHYYKLSEERDEILRIPEARDRYHYLIEHFPELTNAVPDKHLATFLCMNPVTLSRARNNWKNKSSK